jgi:hypothetical protein
MTTLKTDVSLVKCPFCRAQPGEPCMEYGSSEPLRLFHNSRHQKYKEELMRKANAFVQELEQKAEEINRKSKTWGSW